MTSERRRPFPRTLARYLQREFLRTFLVAMGAFATIYLLADFFDRFDTLLRHDASLGTMVRAFALKLPLLLGQVTPLAVLAATLVALGLMARHHEIIALRACGVSLWQILAPLLGLALVVALVGFAWSEVVVPASARRAHEVWVREVKGKSSASVFAGREVWYRGDAGMYNIQRVRVRRATLLGLTVYQLGPNFTPERIVTVGRAQWNGTSWDLDTVETQTMVGNDIVVSPGAPSGFRLPETLSDFQVVDVEPEAFSFAMLRRQIRRLHAKGVDTSEAWVDLYLKIALPAASIVMVLLAVPLAVHGTRASGLAAAVGLGFMIGFAYFIVLAFARALGQNGALPPMLAAWVSNLLFSVLALYLVLGSE